LCSSAGPVEPGRLRQCENPHAFIDDGNNASAWAALELAGM
jgi:hypothetical protein